MNMKKNKDEWKKTRFIFSSLSKVAAFSKKTVTGLNKNREGKYSITVIGLGAGLLALLLLIIMLFVPPFLGMSDDGSFARRINPAGIYHREDTGENLYFNYFVREYLSLAPESGLFAGFTGQRALIFAAKGLDGLFTRDSIFDLRFLALIYGLLYIPAIVLLVGQAAYRVKTFTESVVIGLAGVIIFADVSYITYFSSFYTEPLVLISIVFCAGAALALQQERHNMFYLIVYTVFGSVLTTIENKYAIAGLFLGILGVKFVFMNKSLLWRAGCIASVLLLFFSVMFSAAYAPSSFTLSGKYNAMTRGVLLQSTDPEKTLREFGIEGAYSILADTSSNEQYLLVDPENKDLKQGFYDRYNSAEIAYYYLKHPRSLVAMLDISVKAAFNIRRDYSGNFERGAGMPKMAKSLFWSIWSSFKTNSIPKTIGFLLVLLAAIVLLFRKKSVKIIGGYRQRSSIPLEVMLVIFCIGVSNAMITIVNSGDAEMIQNLFLFSVSLDLIIYFSLAEVLHRLKIL